MSLPGHPRSGHAVSRLEKWLLAQVVGLSLLLVGLLAFYNQGLVKQVVHWVAPPRMELETPIEDQTPTPWQAVEDLSVLEGAWRTEDGMLLVSFTAPASGPPGWARTWHLRVEGDHSRPALDCELYEELQSVEPLPNQFPWRLAYCPGASRATLLRAPGVEYLRLVVGTLFDLDLFQVR